MLCAAEKMGKPVYYQIYPLGGSAPGAEHGSNTRKYIARHLTTKSVVLSKLEVVRILAPGAEPLTETTFNSQS